MEGAFIKNLWQLLEKLHKRMYVHAVTVLASELLKLVPVAALALLIDTLIAFNPAKIPLILELIGGMFVASSIISWLDIRIQTESANIGFDAEVDLLNRSAKKLLFLPIGYHERNNTGSVVHRLHRGTDRLAELIFFAGRDLFPTVLQTCITFVVLLWVGWLPALVFFLFLPIFFLLVHRYGIRVQPLRRQYHEKMEEAAGFIGERVMNVRTLQDFSAEPRELRSYGGLLGEYLTLERKRIRFQGNCFLLRDFFMNVSRATIMGTGVWMVLNHLMTAGTLVLFITLTEKANLSLFRMATFYDRLGDIMQAIERLIALFNIREELPQSATPKQIDVFAGAIEFRDVHFSYGVGNEVLRSVSLAVEPKQTIAVVGRSGSGKSTLVKLLYRHFDVKSGAILVDGTDIRDYALEKYRGRLASVPQDVEIFNATVRENIAFGKDDATDGQIREAARVAHAHEFIDAFPKGYDTLVGERGVRLSGGQRQRIGIARALLIRPGILIFDEATSSLDTESEQLIQKAISSIAKQCTMIIIAHRLSTIEHADMVIVLENGTIAEMGTHEDLLSKKGIYKKMRELQRLGEVRK